MIQQSNKFLPFFLFRMIYQTEDDSVHAKGKDDVTGVSVKFVSNSLRTKKQPRSDKNFDNVNFRPDSRVPLQMSDMYGDTIVDEYPCADDIEYDDRQPIIGNAI